MALILCLCLAIGVGGAMAQTKGPVVTQTAFSKIDADKNGVVTVAEYAAFWKGRFQEIDADKDGKIMADEFAAATKQAFGAADTNKDNVLVAQEFVAYWCGPEAQVPARAKGKTGKRIDANRDGKIDKDECVVFWIARVNDMDTNKDGRVTMDEFIAMTQKQFKEMDRNGDGFISVQEYDFYWSAKTPPAGKGK
jgi:Ca2+-binding EF-hand superfamily protein